MPRRRAAADRTYAQNVTVQNDKFRAELLAQHIDEARAAARELAKARKANEQASA